MMFTTVPDLKGIVFHAGFYVKAILLFENEYALMRCPVPSRDAYRISYPIHAKQFTEDCRPIVMEAIALLNEKRLSAGMQPIPTKGEKDGTG